MTATYFNRNSAGHSIRGTKAREQGAMAWSKLPASLKRGLTADQANALGITAEWHHAGKHASRTPVYYLDQVATFWATLDATDATPEQVTTHIASLNTMNFADRQFLAQAMGDAREAAEQIRLEITGE